VVTRTIAELEAALLAEQRKTESLRVRLKYFRDRYLELVKKLDAYERTKEEPGC
jgi:uncharacterized coiled-coil protein SlyX